MAPDRNRSRTSSIPALAAKKAVCSSRKFVLMFVSEFDATIMPIRMALISSSVSKAMIKATPRSDDLVFVLWSLIINVLLAGHRLVRGSHRTIVKGNFSLERSLDDFACLEIGNRGVADQQADLDRFDGG